MTNPDGAASRRLLIASVAKTAEGKHAKRINYRGKFTLKPPLGGSSILESIPPISGKLGLGLFLGLPHCEAWLCMEECGFGCTKVLIPMFVELYRSTGLSQSGQYPTLFPFFWYNDNKPQVFGFRILRQPDIRA